MPEVSIIETEIGTFKGFTESGLEFAAEIISPYHTEYRPNIGEFIVVMLSPEKALLGRITRFYPMGVLSSGQGDEYLAEMRRRNKEIPEDLKETKLRYNVDVKLLGGLEIVTNNFKYHPSIRQLPHLGAQVGTLSLEGTKYVCSLAKDGELSVPIGNYVLGEQVYDGLSRAEVPVLFDLEHLIARRSFVFARAGYGKSNLIKFLTAKLYEREQHEGMLIFDPEGEYAFRDQKGRPGLADIPYLSEKLVVYTNRHIPAPQKRWVAGDVKLNCGDLRPVDLVNLCIAPGKQDAVFANVLRGLEDGPWRELIALISREKYRADDSEIGRITQYGREGRDNVVINAIKNNLTPIIGALHSDDSDIIESLPEFLSKGYIVVVDISLLSSANGYRIAGLILNELFRRNQENFIAGSSGEVIPIITVLEEAQSVLPKGVSDASPFVAWVKEGRKYQLGAILVTQQPGSIAPEFLSQGDNFFAFHLLSAGDLKALQGHNAHFSDDILASILNEPIKGNAYMWSAPDQPFIIPVRIADFEAFVQKVNEAMAGEPKDFQTPAEILHTQRPRRRDVLRELVMKMVQNDTRIALHSVAEFNGEPVHGIVAVTNWNLRFCIGEALMGNRDLQSTFCKILPDGKVVLKEKTCIEMLDELGLLFKVIRREEGKVTYLLQGINPERPIKQTGYRVRDDGKF